MKHKILIYSKDKNTGLNFSVVNYFEITQEQIEEWTLKDFIENNSSYLRDDREYFAEIDKTIC